MNNDERINIILDSLEEGDIVPMYDWLERKLNEYDRQSEKNHRIIIEEMTEKNLIKKQSTDREVYGITSRGAEIVRSGGWLKHLLDHMSDNEKIHQLLQSSESDLKSSLNVSTERKITNEPQSKSGMSTNIIYPIIVGIILIIIALILKYGFNVTF